MKRLIYLSALILTIVLCSCKSKPSNPSGLEITAEGIPVIDLERKYPEKNIVLQDIADVTYIPLENRDDIIVEGTMLPYYSQNSFVTYNGSQGDVFIFDSRTGKLRSKFNQKGNSGEEYVTISSLAYDEKRGEVFINNSLKKKILIYSDRGDYLRCIDYPQDQSFGLMVNYDDHSLLVKNTFTPRSDISLYNQQNPFFFISKQNGEITSHIETKYSNRLSDRVYVTIDEHTMMPILIAITENIKYGDEILLSELSADTLFLYTKEKKLEPLFIRTPSVWDEKAFIGISPNIKTDDFIGLSGAVYDFEKIKKELRDGGNPSLSSFYYLFNLKTQEIFTPNFINNDSSSGFKYASSHKTDIAVKNTSVNMIIAEKLITALEKGYLSGKLKEVAEGLKDDDNPVLMVVCYK